MHYTRNISKNIVWVGGNDRRLELFENLFPLPHGVSYNSYLIRDEKNTLIDTVDSSISRQFLENIKHTLNGKTLDYLVVNHMEPDHCANIEELMRLFPNLKIIGNAKTFQMIQQFYNVDLQNRAIEVKENDKIHIGEHCLTFIMAPMVHWPETMMTYEISQKILFSADAFGSFGALDGAIFDDEISFDRDWSNEARRYYSNIVGKYGPQVQAVLKKASALNIQTICPLHGPIWRCDLNYILDKYNRWSSYQPEQKGVSIWFGSMYGDTANAAEILAGRLSDLGVKNISVYDVSKTHVSYLIASAFQNSHLVFASPTYNTGIYPAMHNALIDMKALNVQNRVVSIIENGSWAPQAGRKIQDLLNTMKNMSVLNPMISIRSALKQEQHEQIQLLSQTIAKSIHLCHS